MNASHDKSTAPYVAGVARLSDGAVIFGKDWHLVVRVDPEMPRGVAAMVDANDQLIVMVGLDKAV